MVDGSAEVEMLGHLPFETLVIWMRHRPDPLAAWRGACERLAAALMYLTVTGDKSSRSTLISIITKLCVLSASTSAFRSSESVLTSNPVPPQSRARAAYGQGGMSSSSRRSTTGRKMPHPPLLISSTMGFSLSMGAWEISGPVI